MVQARASSSLRTRCRVGARRWSIPGLVFALWFFATCEAAGYVPPLPTEDPEFLSIGTCGDLSLERTGGERHLLGDRLRLGAFPCPDDPDPFHFVHDERSSDGSVTSSHQQVVWSPTRRKFYVQSRELHRFLRGDLASAVPGVLGYPPPRMYELDLPGLDEAVLVLPGQRGHGREGITLAEVFTVTPDGRVQRTQFVALGGMVFDGGCERLALALVRGMRGGAELRPPSPAGRRELRRGITVDVPAGWRVEGGYHIDAGAYRLVPLIALEDGEAWFGMYTGLVAPRRSPEPARAMPGLLFGRDVTWWDGRDGAIHMRHASVHDEVEPAFVGFGAEDDAVFEEFARVAGTLRRER